MNRFGLDGRRRMVEHGPQPGSSEFSLPEELRTSELIRNRVFYAIPNRLLELIRDAIGAERFGHAAFELEMTASSACAARHSCVGLWNGRPICHDYLCKTESVFGPLDDMAEEWGMTVAQVSLALQTGSELLDHFAAVGAGYVGWMMTNADFLDDHDRLFLRWRSEVRDWGIPRVGPVVSRAGVLGREVRDDGGKLSSFVHEFVAFLAKWRLQSLAGPYLPIPLEPLFGGSIPASIVQQLMGVGGLFFLPDTYPVPSRDELRNLLDGAVRGGQQVDHLGEWTRIVRASNPARNQIYQNARLFKLQHYWRVLHQRHSNSLTNQISRLESIFSQYLKVSQSSVHSDLRLIRDRLGQQWASRGSSLPL